MSNPIDHIFDRVTKTTYVILIRRPGKKLNLVVDPGLARPWSSKNKRLADFHARQNRGEARTVEDAFALLKQDNPKFEEELYGRIQAKADQFTKDITTQHNAKR